LERREAVALLKEIVAKNLAEPSLVDLNESKPGKFDLILKGNFDVLAIKKLIANKDLTAKEDKAKGYFKIS
jgi:hypothetical protein